MNLKRMKLSRLIPVFCALIAALVSCSSPKNMAQRYTLPEEVLGDYKPQGEIVSMMLPVSASGPAERRVLVYLPKEYKTCKDKSYPALYLFHGAKGNELDWIRKGDILQTVDSLWAGGHCKPFILVFPGMNYFEDEADYAYSRAKNPFEAIFEVRGQVEHVFIRDVVRKVESNFRVIPDKAHRAIAGLSLGGLQTAYITATFPDEFDYVGLFSPLYACPLPKGEYKWFYSDYETKLRNQFKDAPKLFYIGVGKADIFYMEACHFRDHFKNLKYPVEFEAIKGGHDWNVWTANFDHFSKKLFKD